MENIGNTEVWTSKRTDDYPDLSTDYPFSFFTKLTQKKTQNLYLFYNNPNHRFFTNNYTLLCRTIKVLKSFIKFIKNVKTTFVITISPNYLKK